MTRKWYILKVKPHKERIVRRQLLAKGIEVYFPALQVKPVNPRASKVRPYFPGYLFVHVDLGQKGNDALRWIPGAHGLVRFGGEPGVVPQALIAELKKRLALLEQEAPAGERQIEKGDRVRITKGPFAGYEALFDAHLAAHDRVQVLLAFLGAYPRRVTLDAAAIEKLQR